MVISTLSSIIVLKEMMLNTCKHTFSKKCVYNFSLVIYELIHFVCYSAV